MCSNYGGTMTRITALFFLMTVVPAGVLFGSEARSPYVALGAGFQNSYTRITLTVDGPVSDRSRIGGAVQGFYAFSDRTWNDARYSPAALAVEPYWKRYGRNTGRSLHPWLQIGVPVGTVFIPSPWRAGNNMIGGVRFTWGADLSLSNGGAIFLEASLGAILHFVFGDSADDPYSTDIDSFSGFGIAAGYRF